MIGNALRESAKVLRGGGGFLGLFFLTNPVVLSVLYVKTGGRVKLNRRSLQKMINHPFFNREIKPFTSLLIILCTLLLVAFFKITLRQMSYSLYQKNKEFHKIQDEYYSNMKVYHKMTQPSQLENLAKKHSLDKKKKGQVIQVIDGKAFVID